MRGLRTHLTYANVMATIAVLLALGVGSVYAASKISGKAIRKGSEPGNRLKKNSVTGKQINEATLASVPRSNLANDLVAPEGFHEVGAAGEPGFQNSWQNSANTADEPAGFFKDREGIVHLEGALTGGPPFNTIFQLPPGYRPAAIQFATAACECTGGATTATIAINDGAVSISNGNPASPGSRLFLDGITFRAGS